MASGMYVRMRKFSFSSKMYGFDRVDRDRESEIVARLSRNTNSSQLAFDQLFPESNYEEWKQEKCKYRTCSRKLCNHASRALTKDDMRWEETGKPPRQVLAEERYVEHIFSRLQNTHTASSKSKKRDTQQDDQSEDKFSTSESQPASSNPTTRLQQKPSTQNAMLGGQTLGVFLNIGTASSSSFRADDKEEKSVSTMNALTLKALGKFKFSSQRPKIEQEKRLRVAKGITSEYEIVNSTEFVRKYEREMARHNKLAKMARPTYSSKCKRFNKCTICEENGDIADQWVINKSTMCERCKRDHEDTLSLLYTGKPKHNVEPQSIESSFDVGEGEEEGEDVVEIPQQTQGGDSEEDKRLRLLMEQEDLVQRLRVPTRSSEGGQPFCKRTNKVPEIGYTIIGIPRPKSSLDRIKSAKKKQAAIDEVTERLYRPKSVRSLRDYY